MAIKVINRIQEIKKDIVSNVEAACEEIGVAAVATVQFSTPVDTGALRRSKTFEVRKANRGRFRIVVGTSIHYAPIVNAKSHRKYFNNALASFSPQAREILNKRIGRIRGVIE